ncbi:MAG: DUF2111 domain-containing protein [archaeon]|nr:DUF2111 domain-containing protein [archaeon]
MKEGIVLNEDSAAEKLAPIAKAVNDLLVIPVTMRSKNKKGVCVEKGEVIDFDYTGPVLERALEENRVIRTTPLTERYARIPVIVTPIRNKKGGGYSGFRRCGCGRNAGFRSGICRLPPCS